MAPPAIGPTGEPVRPSRRRAKLRSDRVVGTAAALLGVLMVSPDALVIRVVDADAWSILLLRSIPTAIALFVIIRVTDRRSPAARFRQAGVWGMLVTLLTAVSNVFWVTAITHTATANALVIFAGVPLFAALLGWALLHERVAAQTWVALVVVTVAVVALVAGGVESGNLVGDASALGATLCLALSLNLMRKAKGLSMLPAIAAAQVLVALVAFVPAAPERVAGSDIALIGVFALLLFAPAVSLFSFAPRLIAAGEVGLVLPLETVLGSLWVWLWLGEAPSPAAATAGVVIIGTLVAHSVWMLRRTGPVLPARAPGASFGLPGAVMDPSAATGEAAP